MVPVEDPRTTSSRAGQVRFSVGGYRTAGLCLLCAPLAQHYPSGYRDIPGNPSDFANGVTDVPPEPHKLSSYRTWDLQGSGARYKRPVLTLGVRNLFDEDPPYADVGAARSPFQRGMTCPMSMYTTASSTAITVTHSSDA